MSDLERKQYDQVMSGFIGQLNALCNEGFNPCDMIPVITDFLMMNVLAMCHTQNIGIYAVHAMIHRMTGTLNDWVLGKPPFKETNGSIFFQETEASD